MMFPFLLFIGVCSALPKADFKLYHTSAQIQQALNSMKCNFTIVPIIL